MATDAGRRLSNAESDELAPLPGHVSGHLHVHNRRVSRAVRPSRGRIGHLPGHLTGHVPHDSMAQRLQLENTYRMRPDHGGRFNCLQARELAMRLLRGTLDDQWYEPGLCRTACSCLADSLRRELKDLESKRYKLVVNVCIAQQLGQGLFLASRGVCDCETDNFVTVEFGCNDIHCVAVVHAVYFE